MRCSNNKRHVWISNRTCRFGTSSELLEDDFEFVKREDSSFSLVVKPQPQAFLHGIVNHSLVIKKEQLE